MIGPQLFYLISMLCLITFIGIVYYYYKRKEWGAIKGILAVSIFFMVTDFLMESEEISRPSGFKGYPNSLYIFGSTGWPIEMLFFCLGSGAIMGALIWIFWTRKGISIDWINGILILWSILAFLLALLGVISLLFSLMPAMIWGIVTIMRYKPRLIGLVVLIAIGAMVIEGIMEFYFLESGTYEAFEDYDMLMIMLYYFAYGFIGSGIIAYAFYRDKKGGE